MALHDYRGTDHEQSAMGTFERDICVDTSLACGKEIRLLGKAYRMFEWMDDDEGQEGRMNGAEDVGS